VGGSLPDMGTAARAALLERDADCVRQPVEVGGAPRGAVEEPGAVPADYAVMLRLADGPDVDLRRCLVLP
jgi:hypothetical protein